MRPATDVTLVPLREAESVSSYTARCGASATLSLAAQAAEKRLDRTFTVSPGGRLTIESDGSDLRVEGASGNQVEVHVLMKGAERALERLTLSAEQSGDDVAVLAKHGPGKWTDLFGGWNMDGRIEVKVPHQYNIDIRTSGGDIVVAQLQGEARARTSGGDIKVTEVRGPVDMQTSGGDVRAAVANAEDDDSRRALSALALEPLDGEPVTGYADDVLARRLLRAA